MSSGPTGTAPDLVIVGGGVIGCSAAAFAAERGASVILLEAAGVGAGASGRNSGAVQHPFDPVLADLHTATLHVYRDLAEADDGFGFPASPAGLLLLTDDPAEAAAHARGLAGAHPELEARALAPDALREVEPLLAPDLSAVWLATGYPIPPDAATAAMGRRATRAGAEIRTGVTVDRVEWDGRRVRGVHLADGSTLEAAAILVAAGPWSPPLVDAGGEWRPLRPTHGVTVQVALPSPARCVLEEGVVHTVNRPVDALADTDLASTFSLVSVNSGGASTGTVGSTFLAAPPDAEATAPLLVARGARFVPSLARARILRSRVCMRPQSLDGLPLVGTLPGVEGLAVCTGHGPWGISTGPASAALVVDSILGRDDAGIPPELAPGRFGEVRS